MLEEPQKDTGSGNEIHFTPTGRESTDPGTV